MTGGLVPPPLL